MSRRHFSEKVFSEITKDMTPGSSFLLLCSQDSLFVPPFLSDAQMSVQKPHLGAPLVERIEMMPS